MTIHSCVPQRYSRVFVVGECGLTPIYQVVFRRLLPRLGYHSAIWAVAHRLCRMVWKISYEGVRFIEQGVEPDPKATKKRAQMLARVLRKLGYEVTITPRNLAIAENGMQI